MKTELLIQMDGVRGVQENEQVIYVLLVRTALIYVVKIAYLS